MLFDLLTELDKQRITNYIKSYVYVDTYSPMAPLDRILAPWDKAKSEYLKDIFGDQLIVSKEVEFKEDMHEIMDKIEEILYRDNRCSDFMEKIKAVYEPDWDTSDWDDPARVEHRLVTRLFDYPTLAQNKATGYGTGTIHIKDKEFKIQENAKPLRIIAKIANAYNIGIEAGADGISDLEYFRRQHSLCLNNKMLKGNLCLSIHPLDFMTMSDNACGWGSCMSWIENGEYRQGTVEMMNSPCVVVAYLASDKELNFGGWGSGEDYTWNSKKWRCLFIVDRDFIINVKEYPYYNDNLVKETIKELAKLSGWGEAHPEKFKYLNDYDNYRRSKTPCEIDGKQVALSFCTNHMYCDFNTEHFIAINPNAPDSIIDHFYNYSGDTECMWCGNNHDECDDNSLTCWNCNPRSYCECCDEDVHPDDLYTTGEGINICEYCWCDYTQKDFFDENCYLTDNMYHLRINLTNDAENVKFFDDDDDPVYVYVSHPKEKWLKYFTVDAPHPYSMGKYHRTQHYFNLEECTDAFFDHFGQTKEEMLAQLNNI